MKSAMTSPLADKTALVIGVGGLGGPALLALAAAGVGRLVFIDGDAVETSNLTRQPLFGEADLGERKVVAAARRLARRYPALKLEPHDRRFDDGVALALARDCDVVVDGSDNFATKFLASDAAVEARRPLVHGGVLRYSAQLLTVLPGQTGCLRCLFEGPPPPGSVPSCAEAGVLGPLAGFAGSLMGAEAVRILSGERGAYAGRVAIYEARMARSRSAPVRRRAGCLGCQALGPVEAPAPEAPAGEAPPAEAASPGPAPEGGAQA
jgi:molybdopterin-synthase adenylyltransferase